MMQILNAAVIAFIGLAIYFCPTGIAVRHKHHNAKAIFVLNLLLGWTFIGWIIALVWANTAPRWT